MVGTINIGVLIAYLLLIVGAVILWVWFISKLFIEVTNPANWKAPPPEPPPLPQFCEVCGKKLILVEDADGFYSDNGDPKFKRWFRCPDWKGGQTMFLPGAFITYTALVLDREQKFLMPRFGYTRYQTCNNMVVY